MAEYEVLLFDPPGSKPVPTRLTAPSHDDAIAQVDASLDGHTGDDADVELHHLASPEGPVPLARWTRRSPERAFERAS